MDGMADILKRKGGVSYAKKCWFYIAGNEQNHQCMPNACQIITSFLPCIADVADVDGAGVAGAAGASGECFHGTASNRKSNVCP